jgi:ADP-dependent NAD(P)H-hydrate dehydratase
MERVTGVPSLPPRRSAAHKGSFGTVLVVGGSRGMAGAAALAGRAALEGGCGLARVAVPGCVLDSVAAMAPACTTLPLAGTPRGRLHPRSAVEVLRALDTADVLAIGPGLGCDGSTTMAVRSILENTDRATVVDADALNCLARVGGIGGLTSKPATLVITPHPGEAARLLGITTDEVQADRQAAAARLAADGTIVLLKGQGTVVTDGYRMYVNKTGNAGMATGGSGDVLTGLVAALLAQGMHGFDAAVLAAHVHGVAGDRAAEEQGQASVTAESVLHCLGQSLLVSCAAH